MTHLFLLSFLLAGLGESLTASLSPVLIPPYARHLHLADAANALTSSVVRAFPPTPHPPLAVSSKITTVYGRRASPSMATIASVNFLTTSFFCSLLKTPSIALT